MGIGHFESLVLLLITCLYFLLGYYSYLGLHHQILQLCAVCVHRVT